MERKNIIDLTKETRKIPEDRKGKIIKIMKESFGNRVEGDYQKVKIVLDLDDPDYEKTDDGKLELIINWDLLASLRGGDIMGAFKNQEGSYLRIFKEYEEMAIRYHDLYLQKFKTAPKIELI